MAKKQGSFSVIDAALSFDQAAAAELALLDGKAGAAMRLGGLVWTMPQGLVVPKSFQNYMRFQAAVEEMAGLGWPVHLRQTGGDLTPQGPGVINISYVFSQPVESGLSITGAYERLCQPILRYLDQAYGIRAYCSEVSGAFCDGKFNVVVDGIKIAGTAQKWRPYRGSDGQPMIAVLAHAALMGDVAVPEMIAACNRFYQLCDVDRLITEDRQTALAKLLPAGAYDKAEVMAGLCAALEEDALYEAGAGAG